MAMAHFARKKLKRFLIFLHVQRGVRQDGFFRLPDAVQGL
jgi:hypothetical protein